MLSEDQCMKIETALTEDVEPRKVAAYLCLHMGLSVAEVTALRFDDIDLTAGTVTIRNVFSRPEDSDSKTPAELVRAETPRTLPMPSHVQKYLFSYHRFYTSGNCFILSAQTDLPASYQLQSMLFSICVKYKIANTLSATQLRNAFVRRCIQSGMDLYSLCAYIGIKQPNVLVKKFAGYFTPHLDSVNTLEKFSADYTLPVASEPAAPGAKRMNLLILGAGGQSYVVEEVAQSIGVFNEIGFLDDDPNNERAIGKCDDCKKFLNEYPIAIPSVGNGELRMRWIKMLMEAGFILPTLIDTTATVSPSAQIGYGTLIEPKATIGANAKIGIGCIISSGAIIDRGVAIPDGTHIDCGAAVRKSGA